MRQVKCYHCGQYEDKENLILEIHKTEKNEYKRYLHKDNCHEAYLFNIKEKQEMDKLCNYIKYEILKYEKKVKFPPHLFHRLQGLRCGEFGMKTGVKVFNSENGYEYSTILMTFKVKKMDIINAISQNYKFKSEQNKIDYMISIVLNSINDVYFRIKEKEESDKKLKEKNYESDMYNAEYEYKNKSNIKENQVADLLDDLW